jgi:hypothetical protein
MVPLVLEPGGVELKSGGGEVLDVSWFELAKGKAEGTRRKPQSEGYLSFVCFGKPRNDGEKKSWRCWEMGKRSVLHQRGTEHIANRKEVGFPDPTFPQVKDSASWMTWLSAD